MNSMPASSASWANRMLLSQEFTQRSSIFVTDMPPEQFGEKKPNLSLLLLRIGDCFRPMKCRQPQRGFYELGNCVLCRKTGIVQGLYALEKEAGRFGD